MLRLCITLIVIYTVSSQLNLAEKKHELPGVEDQEGEATVKQAQPQEFFSTLPFSCLGGPGPQIEQTKADHIHLHGSQPHRLTGRFILMQHRLLNRYGQDCLRASRPFSVG